MPSTDHCPVCIKNPLEDSKNFTNVSWIQCDICLQWFHSKCLDITLLEVANLHSYHCQDCSKKHGGSIFKRKSKRTKTQIDYVALNEGEAFAVDKLSHQHVSSFMKFPVDASAEKVNPYIEIRDDLTKDFALESELVKPILIPRADLTKVGMELPIPKKDITIEYITDKVGEDVLVEVMDVISQQGVQPGWNMQKWRDYFQTEEAVRDRIRNVISLEISQVEKLGTTFHRPQLVRDLDLVDKVWDPNDEQKRSQVTKYCLMSVKNSFTDFHIDFGGTSVYYTVCSGAKTFLMFPPTDENLQCYTSWCLEPNQNYTWFADHSIMSKGKRLNPKNGFKVTLNVGDLFIIPSGWIHAVFTPQDSIVIGGNFLTLLNMRTQLKINNIEKETKVPAKFRFPMFNKVHWLTSWYYLHHQDEFSNDLRPTPNVKLETPTAEIEYETLQSLILHLNSHYILSKTNQQARRSIPINLIGRNIPKYLETLESWLHSYKND